MPELYKRGQQREDGLAQTRNCLISQRLTRIFPKRHAEDGVSFHFNGRQFLGGLACQLVNLLTSNFIFGRVITEWLVNARIEIPLGLAGEVSGGETNLAGARGGERRRRYFSPTVSRSSRDTAIACNAALTTWDARAFCDASCAFVSSNSACARITPSWLLSLCSSSFESSVTAFNLRSRVIRGVLRAVRFAPQRIDEDTNAAAGGAQVLHLVCRNPVVDRASADTDHFARLHDADCLPFHWGLPPVVVSVQAFLRLGVHSEPLRFLWP